MQHGRRQRELFGKTTGGHRLMHFPRNEKEKIFNDHIAKLHGRKREQFRKLLDETLEVSGKICYWKRLLMISYVIQILSS